MSAQEHIAPRRSNSYELFILVLTVMSLTIMGLQFAGNVGLLPLTSQELELLNVYDNVTCIIFLVDFAMNMIQTRPRRDYFIGRRGWLDLIGSIPSFGISQFGSLLRLARISRLTRITRLLRGQRKKELVDDIIKNRGQYALFVTIMAAFIVLVTSSLLVLQFESANPDANIVTGGDALWWSIVTITTVGYGDFFPITTLGRITGIFVMFAGVGIIGALASILASILVPQPSEMNAPTGPDPGVGSQVADELAALRAEVSALRESLAGAPKA